MLVYEFLCQQGLTEDDDFDGNTIDSIKEMGLFNGIDIDDLLENLKVFSIQEILGYNKRLTYNSEVDYLNHLEEGEVFHNEIIADLIIEALSHTSKTVLSYNDSFYGYYYVYIKEEDL